MTACARAEVARVDTIAWPDTTTTEWVATSIGGQAPAPGTRVTMGTSPTGVGGYSGCNWFGIRRENGRPLIMGTARGCPGPVGDQEQRYTNRLASATRAIRRADTLVLLDSLSAPLLTFVRRTPTSSRGDQLVGTEWRLTSATWEGVRTDSVTLRFTRDSVAVFGGCRRFEGTYTTTDDHLRFTSMGTRVAADCINREVGTSEEHLTSAFSETEHFYVRGDTLVMMTFGGDTLRWRRISSR